MVWLLLRGEFTASPHCSIDRAIGKPAIYTGNDTPEWWRGPIRAWYHAGRVYFETSRARHEWLTESCPSFSFVPVWFDRLNYRAHIRLVFATDAERMAYALRWSDDLA